MSYLMFAFLMSATAHGPEIRNGDCLPKNRRDRVLVVDRALQGLVALLTQGDKLGAGRERARRVDGDVLRVRIAGGGLGEEVAAGRPEERVDVIRVALLADLQRQDLVRLAIGDERLAGRDEVLDRRRSVRHEIGVAEQGDVLDRVRDAVQLAVEGHALHCERVEG